MGIPNNLVDAAAALKSGDPGLIQVVKIGDIVVSALLGLYAPSRMRVTRKPVEEGYDINDAAVLEPRDVYMDICLANPDLSAESALNAALTGNPGSLISTWREKKEKLWGYHSEKQLVTVVTHEGSYESMLVSEIDPYWDVGGNWDALFANIRLEQIRKIGETVGGIFDASQVDIGGL